MKETINILLFVALLAVVAGIVYVLNYSSDPNSGGGGGGGTGTPKNYSNAITTDASGNTLYGGFTMQQLAAYGITPVWNFGAQSYTYTMGNTTYSTLPDALNTYYFQNN